MRRMADRIRGTNDAKSIGRAESSGRFRMLNSAVLHLATITEIGTPVAAVSALAKREEVAGVPDAAREGTASGQQKEAVPAVADDRVR